LPASRLFESNICSRCLRTSSRRVHGRLCPSCYNRERENIEGKNARGNPLKLVRKYYPVALLVAKTESVHLRIMDRVMSMPEAVISILLNENENVMFGEAESGLFFSHAN
jgi:hypothetical protein